MKEVCMEAQSTTPSYNRIQNFERFSQRSPFLRYPIPLLDGMGPILSATKFPIILVIIIFSVSVIFLEIFSKTSQAPQFDHFLTTFLPISPEPLDRFCSSSNMPEIDRPTSFKKRFTQINSDLLELSLGQTDRRTDRRTDRQTDRRTNIFFC